MTRLFLDIEVYKNYFLALIMGEDGRTARYEVFNGEHSGMDAVDFFKVISHEDVELVTFNGINYDIPVLTHMLINQDTEDAKRASDRIIERNVKPWAFYRDEGLREPELNHIDLIEVAPGMMSLKIYGGRLHSPRLQELPIHNKAEILPDQVALMRKYCRNDLLVTQMLYKALGEQINLRRTMSEEYGVDLRSKSDAQIAEAVLKAEYVRMTGSTPAKTVVGYDRFFYQPPAYVKFSTPELRDVLGTVCSAEMVLDSKTGHVKMPATIQRLVIKIGNSSYKIGIGGLHSQESEVAHFSDDENVLIDRDVESYYPRMMLNMNMQPGGFGKYFNPVFGKILDERLAAKHKLPELKKRIAELEKELAECVD